MATITLDVPDELAAQLAGVRDRLPELLALSLHQPALPAALYRHVLDFLASNPTPAQIIAFRPSPEMEQRLAALLERSRSATLTTVEVTVIERSAVEVPGDAH